MKLSPLQIASEISLIDHQILQLESRRCSLLVLAAQQQTDKEDALLSSLEDSSVSAGDEATFSMSALPPPPPPPSSMTAMEEEEEVANDQFPTCAKILEEEPVAKDHFAACAKRLNLEATHGITSSRGMQASLAYYLHKGDDGMAVLRCGSGKTKAALLSTLTSQDHLLLFICPLRGLARQVQDDANSIVDGSAMSSVIGGSTAFDDDDGELVADDGYDDDGAVHLDEVAVDIPDDSPQGILLKAAGKTVFVLTLTPDAINPERPTTNSRRWFHALCLLRQEDIYRRCVFDEVNTYLYSIFGSFRSSMRSLGSTLDLIDSGDGSSGVPTSPRPARFGLTGTASDLEVSLLSSQLGLHSPVFIREPLDRSNMVLRFLDLNGIDGKGIHLLMDMSSYVVPFIRHTEGRSVVFVQKQSDAENIATHLANEHGLQAFPYHGGLRGKGRESSLSAFTSTDRSVLVSTQLFGRGHDVGDISLVVHLCLRWKPEQIWQEACRGGRNGREFTVIQVLHASMISSLRSADFSYAAETISYATSRHGCRRFALLRSLGDSCCTSTECRACPTCVPELWLGAGANIGFEPRDLSAAGVALLSYCSEPRTVSAVLVNCAHVWGATGVVLPLAHAHTLVLFAVGKRFLIFQEGNGNGKEKRGGGHAATYITTNKARTTAASAFACVDCPKICCAVKPCGKP